MLIILLSVMFLSSGQPILMVISLVLLTLFYSFYIYMMTGSYWFSYALVMIMLSGMFVVFIYMASLTPNEEFEIYGMVFLFLFVLAGFISITSFQSPGGFEYISLNLWMFYVGLCMMFFGAFLLSIMLMVIWLSQKTKGALRVL